MKSRSLCPVVRVEDGLANSRVLSLRLAVGVVSAAIETVAVCSGSVNVSSGCLDRS